MILEKFNHINENILCDLGEVGYQEIKANSHNEKLRGIGAIIDNMLIAFAVVDEKLQLVIDGEVFDTENLSFEYAHNANSTTTFSVTGSEMKKSITYPSWWCHSPIPVVAFEADDDEEDFCAYIILMMQSSKRIEQICKKYS
ncbi:hypothetical protein [Flocculibacter collagenilyticus]|uniref:hypothetical protein n=1 Tax=Flocculibacter collagenilyticus TaxID=2744479 RepID=UPI0018F3EE92|nr:hypothetical protein [Flocculibacter collagenilyticus]